MTTETNAQYLDTWWTNRLNTNYGVQWKHIAAAHLLNGDCFPLVDLGAGAGVFLKLLEERFPSAQLQGVELSKTAIANKYCNSGIVQGDITSWMPMERVSTVSLIDVLEHIPDPEPLLQHVAKYADHILIACPNFNFLKARWDVLAGNIPFQNKVGRGGHVYWVQQDMLQKTFDKCGLKVREINHLFPKNNIRFIRKILSFKSSLMAHEFCYLLEVIQ